MLQARTWKSKFILVSTLLLFFAALFIIVGTFFGYDSLKQIEASRIFNRGMKFIVPTVTFGFIAPNIIHFIDTKISSKYEWKRLIAEFLAIAVISIVTGLFTYYVFYIEENVLSGPPIHAASRGPILNLFFGIMIFAIYEVWMTIEKNQRLAQSISKLEKEQVDLKLNALQQKIDPHFLFNSLNVLSELVHEDSQKADEFIHQFSKVYRYVLELNNEVLVTLETELEFLEAYQYLLEIRLGSSLTVDKRIEREQLNALIPPMSLQLLVENAIKHNQASKNNPLVIRISTNSEKLIVENNKQARLSSKNSNGLGLTKLDETFRLMGNYELKIKDLEDRFIVEIPLLKPE